MDYEEDYYETDDEYDEYDDDTYEAEAYLNTRTKFYSKPYPSKPVSKNRRPRKSESRKEETLRVPVADVNENMDAVPIAPIPVTTTPNVTKPRRKMLPAPIEKLDEFNIATYLQDLPCRLSVG